jgi:hypothetical protein
MMDSGRRHLVCLSGAIELEDTKRAFYVMNGREMRNVPSWPLFFMTQCSVVVRFSLFATTNSKRFNANFFPMEKIP